MTLLTRCIKALRQTESAVNTDGQMQELSAPPHSAFDIVAVHGTGSKDGRGVASSRDKDIKWLRRVVSKHLLQAHISSFSFEIDVAPGSKTTPFKPQRVVKSLVAALQAHREQHGNAERPIVFVCNAIGGFIVKRILALHSCAKPDSIRRLSFPSTFSLINVILRGTPNERPHYHTDIEAAHMIIHDVVPCSIANTHKELLPAIKDALDAPEISTDESKSMSKLALAFVGKGEKSRPSAESSYVDSELSE